MSRWGDFAGLMVIAATACIGTGACAATPGYGFGRPATPEEIAGWDIDVRPDGAGLPAGRGSVAQGQAIYDVKCANCHGTFGESNSYLQIAGGVGTLASDQPMRTTGSKLNHATTLWDYINRAMPFNAPKSLTSDEVYALTAFVLNLNDILPADAVLDRDSLPRVVMPNRNGFTTAHGFMRRDGKPDTHNVACMKDCAVKVTMLSQIPEYARDQHGDLAEQTRLRGGAAASPPAALAGLDLAKASGCTTCHGVNEKIVGPPFREINLKYAGDHAAETRLIAKIKSGGAGSWGQVPMPAQTQLQDAQARVLVQWILAGAP
jgi:S-disulfanyl-L-cysteine oxidoreductase SoxD